MNKKKAIEILKEGRSVLIALLGFVASVYFGEIWYMVIGIYIALNTVLRDTINLQERQIKLLKNNINYNRYTRNCEVIKKTQALRSQKADSGVLIDIEIQDFDNLEDEKMPLTRTFHISAN